MSGNSTFTPGSTPVPHGAIVINIHIDGNVVANLKKLVINNDCLPCGGPEKAANSRRNDHAKETQDGANNEEESDNLSADGNTSLPAHQAPAVDEIHDGASTNGDGSDGMDPWDTPPSPESSVVSHDPGSQFKCRLHKCDLEFSNTQEREDHETWAHFLCGRCGAEYGSLDFAESVGYHFFCPGPTCTDRPDYSTGTYT
jgi:hypothetical protein